MDDDGSDRPNGFLARWARRKDQVRSGVAVPAEAPPAVAAGLPAPATPSSAAPPAEAPAAAAAPAPLPTLDDVAALGRESDYTRFVAPGVDPGVRNAAMKKLFTDPHFNVMDGLDTYIDDYGKPDPIPLAMLRQMHQSKLLGLFDDEDDEGRIGDAQGGLPPPTTIPPATAPAPAEPERPAGAAPFEPEPTSDDDTDLQLQPDDAAGRAGPDQGAGA